MAKEKEKKKEEGLDLDFGIGKFSLGGLFKGLENLINLAEKLKEAGGEIKKEGEIDLSHLKEGMKGVFGFTIKSDIGKPGAGVGARPIKVERFGHKVTKTPQGPKVEEEREPLTDVFDEKEEIIVTAEMPGVEEGDIKVDLKEDILDISAQSGDKKYHKEILLPAKVKVETKTSSYKNGVLEIRMKK